MPTALITWPTYLVGIVLMLWACFRIHRKIRSVGSLLLLLTLPFYFLVHNLSASAFAYLMTHRVPSWVNNWVMWGVTEYMPHFVMLLVSIAAFMVAKSIPSPSAEA